MKAVLAFAHLDEVIPPEQRRRVGYRGAPGTTIRRVTMPHGCWLVVQLDGGGAPINVMPSALVEIDDITIPPPPAPGLRLIHGGRA